MAYIVQKKFPLDIPNSPQQKNARGIGISFPFNGDAVFNSTFQTSDQIKANLINYLLTNQGERVFNPNFGANLRKSLFEVEDNTIDIVLEQIQDRVRELFPLVRISSINIEKLQDNHTLKFSIIYSISSYGITDQININLQ